MKNLLKEDFLNESQFDYLKSILHGVGIGSWEWDIQHKKLIFDEQWCQMLGLQFAETTQELSTWETRVHPNDKEKVYQDIKLYLEGKNKVYENVHRIKHSDGSWIWVLDRAVITKRDEHDQPLKLSGIYINITHYKSQEIIAQQIQQTAKIGSWYKDLKNNKLLWTKEHYRIFEIDEKYQEKDLIEKFHSRIHPDDLSEFENKTENIIQQGNACVFNYRLIFDEGKRIKNVCTICQVTRDQEGKAIALSGTSQDISDLMIFNQLHQMSLSHLGIGSWKLNLLSGELTWDKSLYELYGLKEKDFSGHYNAWESTLTEESKERTLKELKQALNSEKEYNTRFEIKTANGEKKFIATRAYIVRNNLGEPMMMFGINWDCSHEVKIEKELAQEREKFIHHAKLASLGEMTAGILHEINNPLAYIDSMVSLLIKTETSNPQPQKKFLSILESMNKAGLKIQKIISGIKKYSRPIQADHFQYYQLKELIDEAVLLTESKTKLNYVDVSIDIQTDRTVFCDDVEMQQVLMNLINNAVDAIKDLEEKWIKINVFEENNWVKIQVIDSGEGISDELEKKLFDPFFTTKPRGVGTGLGLPICKNILQQYQATIQLNRKETHTCFEITLTKTQTQTQAQNKTADGQSAEEKKKVA